MQMKRFSILILAAFVFIPITHAQTTPADVQIYIAQDTKGDDSGSSCENAHSSTWFNTSANWGTTAGKIGPGDTVHLCGTITKSLIVRASGTSGSPITITFEPGAKISMPVWDVVMWDKRAALLVNQREYIKIDGNGGRIEQTEVGTALPNKTGGIGVWLEGCNYCEVSNLTITGMYIRTPRSGDRTGGGNGVAATRPSHSSFHDLTISEAGTGISINYPGNQTTENVKVYGNTISRISNGITVGSGNLNAIARNIEVYNNEIFDEYVWAGTWDGCTGDCWFHNDGIQTWAVHAGSSLSGLKIYGNKIHGDNGTQITGWIFNEGNVEAEVYNNNLSSVPGSNPTNGFIISPGKIYNNTIVGNGGGATGINTGGKLPAEVTGNSISNTRTFLAYSTSSPIISNNNTFFNPVTQGLQFAIVGKGGAYSFSKDLLIWRQRTGFDRQSTYSDSGGVVVAAETGGAQPATNPPPTRESVPEGTVQPPVTGTPGDFNNDGVVNSLDVSLMAGAWNTTNTSYDLSKDNTVNTLDYSIMVRNWTM
jgi:hypothetical protein